jgi:branched-chain amino acid transport system ATP-binding protein
MSATLLTIDSIGVRFGGVVALEAVSFAVDDGDFLGLIGPNGAGKTTLLHVITGVVAPAAGSIALAGRDITRLPVHARVRLGLGLSQQLVRPFRDMSVIENVMLTAGAAKTKRPLRALLSAGRQGERVRAGQLLALVGIAEAAERRPDELPLGVLKRLEVARALALAPKLLLLDEPLAGLNSTEARRFADIIASLNKAGQSIVLIEHNLGEVLRICRRLVVLDNGRIIANGAPRAVMADARVRDAYLGTGAGHAAA